MKFVGRLLAVLAIVTIMLAAGRGSEIDSTPTYTIPLELPYIAPFTQEEMKPVSPYLQASMTKKLKPITKAQIKCLADNIYYEAGNQPWEGKLAVAFVTMKRLSERGYPNSICGVVYERKDPIYCQFTWACENPTRYNRSQWLESFDIAKMMVQYFKTGRPFLEDPTDGALFFHNPKVSFPKWKRVFTLTARIADHDFYRK